MYEEARVWLPAVLDALGIERPVLLGHSDGASIALIHGALPAARIAGIIALAPHINVEQTAIDNIQRAKAAYETTDLRVRLARYHDDVDSAFWGWNRIWLDPSLRSWNIEGLLSAIRAPILAIQGRGDEYGTLEQVEGIRRLVPSAATLILEDCGHSPHRDQPAAVTHAVTAFVENVAARGDSA